MENKERAVIATSTLISSLAFYWYAQANKRSEVPYLLIGGFVGAMAAELILIKIDKRS
ncbi:hypothetical protein [Chitinophaga sp.]|uniref:hypothetical protein n=1 Tax=Chitinophaga sp. TaxID=1869181 RepID=UPI0031D729DA